MLSWTSVGLSMSFLRRFIFAFLFETLFEFGQSPQTVPFVLTDPPIVDLLERHRVEVVELFAPVPDGRHEIGYFKKRKMLRHRLPRHVQVPAKLIQGLTVVPMQLIKQFPATRIGERLEHFIQMGGHRIEIIMQLFGCMSSAPVPHSPTRILSATVLLVLIAGS